MENHSFRAGKGGTELVDTQLKFVQWGMSHHSFSSANEQAQMLQARVEEHRVKGNGWGGTGQRKRGGNPL